MSLVVNIKQDHKNIKIVKTNLMKLLNNQQEFSTLFFKI